MKPVVHRITDVPAYLDVLRDARERGLQVRVGEGGAALVVGDWQAVRGGSTQRPDQEAVSQRLNTLVREQLWSAFYGTAQGPSRALAARDARLHDPAAQGSPALAMNWGAREAGGDRWRQLQGEAYQQLVGLSPGFTSDLTRELDALVDMADGAGAAAVASFAKRAGAFLAREDLPMHERLRLMAEAVLPVINEFGYLGDVAGGGMDARFREAMQKLAQALTLAAGPLQAMDAAADAESRQLRAQLQAAGLERQRSDRAQTVGRAEALRMMATLEGRQVLEQHLNQAIQAAKAAIREDDPKAGEDARRLHNGLGQAQDRLLTPRQGEMEAARWRDAMALAEDHRQELEARDRKPQAAAKTPPSQTPSSTSQHPLAGSPPSPIRTLFGQIGEVRQMLREWVDGSTGGAVDPDDSVPGHKAGQGGPASRRASEGQGVEPAQPGAPRSAGRDPAWSEAAASVVHARTGQSVRADLDHLAAETTRALNDALPSLVGYGVRNGLMAAGGRDGPAEGDRLRALMAAYALALSECEYIHREDSRQRLRAVCQHIVPHLGVMDTLLAAAAAADDYETVEKLFRLRKCLIAAHGNVQPPYLAFQAVPPPPELFREIGRSLASAAMGSGARSASSGLYPQELDARELMAKAGEIIERTVRALLDLLQSAGGAAASRPLGPVLNLAMQRMGGVSDDAGANRISAHALLVAIEADLRFAAASTTNPREAPLLASLVQGLEQLGALLYPALAKAG